MARKDQFIDNQSYQASSRLRRRITVEQPVLTDDGLGGHTTSWNNVATIWAEVTPLRGDEQILNERLAMVATHRFTIRYREDVFANMRIGYDGKYYNIRSIIDAGDAHIFLEIIAEEGVAI